ncbi:hypothetical protein [Sphingosinicella rhizophila]|uniref:Lipoprotein n=1 Tax=Sphingosinicella rhizophila TaxID=3050082 RepID=A0ABU3Q548_9SPHN|nr:hypothetical protein [Sphingosinicella sp. GR2756]MDT9598412.1 hypothetical protein [Sphingosinicella sp. GR2756]
MKHLVAMLFIGLCLSGCGGSNDGADDADPAAANQATTTSGAPTEAAKSLASCPFQETTDWHAYVEGGRLQVNGQVDLLMAGFKPVLTRRADASPGVVAFDLSLVQEAGAAVNDRVTFSGAGATPSRSAEIYCNDKQVAKIEVISVD